MKKKIALLLACAMVATNLCACSGTQLSDTITDLGVNVYEAYENRDEIESEVGDTVTDRFADIAANISSNLHPKKNTSKRNAASSDEEQPTREEDIIRALESATEEEGDNVPVESVDDAVKETIAETQAEKKVAKADSRDSAEGTTKVAKASEGAEEETKADSETEKNTEEETKVVNHELSDALKKLFDEDEELEDLVRASIKAAKKINSDKETNPVQRIDNLYDFVDESYDNPKIDYFCFLFDQTLDEIKTDANPDGYLEYHDPFSGWMKDCIASWTKHDEIKAEPMDIDCQDDEAYAPADITIVEVEKTSANGDGVITVSAKLDGKQATLLAPVCGKIRFEKPTGTDLAVTKWDDEKKEYVSTNPLPTRIIIETEGYGDVVIAPYDFSKRYSFEINTALKTGKSVDHGDVLGTFIYGGEYVVMGFDNNEGFEVVVEKNEDDEYEAVKAGDRIIKLGKPLESVSSLVGNADEETDETDAAANVKPKTATKAGSDSKNEKAVATAESEDEEKTAASADDEEEETSDNTKKEVNYSDDATDFVMVTDVAPKVVQDMRYYSLYNELEERLPGYEQPALLLTNAAAEAVKTVSNKLAAKGYILKIYDAYRPVSAQKALNAKCGAPEFSDNSRGSAVDATLVDMKTGQEVDMSPLMYGYSSDEDTEFTKAQLKNQSILKDAMVAAGFNASDDWYHFTLKNEPYEDTYFTFPLRFDVAGKTKEQREAEVAEQQVTEEKKRKIKYVIEVYDDGTIEVKQEEN